MRVHPTEAIRDGRSPRRYGLVLGMAGISVVLAACGDDKEVPMDPVPTASEVRTQFGVTDGSCVRYRVNGGATTALATMSGPESGRIAGRSAYVWRLVDPGSSQPSLEWLYDAQDDGELRLMRAISGPDPRITRTYACEGSDCGNGDDIEPLVASFEYVDDVPALTKDVPLETVTTPDVSGAQAEMESHRVVYQADVAVMAPYATESAMAQQLLYVRTAASGSDTMTFDLLPGYGFVAMQIGTKRYDACDWRICDDAGTCQGANSCSELSCN